MNTSMPANIQYIFKSSVFNSMLINNAQNKIEHRRDQWITVSIIKYYRNLFLKLQLCFYKGEQRSYIFFKTKLH